MHIKLNLKFNFDMHNTFYIWKIFTFLNIKINKRDMHCEKEVAKSNPLYVP